MMSTRSCTFPKCPAEAYRSPWEPDHTIECQFPGNSNDIIHTTYKNCTRLQVPRRSLDFHYNTMEVPRTTSRHPNLHHAIVLQTAPRPKCTLMLTLQTIGQLSEWRGPRIIASDGPTETTISHSNLLVDKLGWSLSIRSETQGSARAFASSVRLALAADPDLEHLTFIEDDINTCQNFLAYASTVEVPEDVSFVTWFTYDYDWSFPPHPRLPHPSRSARAILACRPSRYFILTQACTFPRRTLERLLSCPMFAHNEWPTREGHDRMIAWALGDSLYATHFPILVNHGGSHNSAVLLDSGKSEASGSDPQAGDRSSPYYVGDTFNAMSLLEETPR